MYKARYDALRALALALVAALGADAAALPAAVRDLVPDARWSLRGEGRLEKFFFHVYDAQLWTAGPDYSPDAPHALAITYARDIAAAQLAARTEAELARMGEWDAAATSAWRGELARAFPAVRAGDQLVGVRLPRQPLRLYLNGAYHAEIREPRLAAAFLGLWLDPRTSEPTLRRRLLGER